MKSTGRVFAEKPSIGIEPTRLYDASRRFKNHGTHTDVTMVRLPSGLWVRSFNGSSSKVTISDAPSLDISLGITLLVWVNVTARPGPDYAGIIDKEDALHPGGAYYYYYIQVVLPISLLEISLTMVISILVTHQFSLMDYGTT